MNINRTNKKKVTIFEAFAGIGSQYKALKNIASKNNYIVESVGIIEWFIPAIIAYQNIHYPNQKPSKDNFNYDANLSNDSKTPISDLTKKKLFNNSEIAFWLNQSKNKAKNLFDITKVKGNDIPKNIDIFTYSFPCQDISNQGKQEGFSKNKQTRSGLLWQIERILEEMDKKHLPKYLLLENVKAIINYKHRKNLNIWIKKLESFGYESKIYVLNSINFNSSQNRERVFILSVLKTHKEKVNFEFANLEEIKLPKKQPIKKIIDKTDQGFNSKYNQFNLNKQKFNKESNVQRFKLENYSNFQSENYVYDINFSGPTLTASGAMSRIKFYFGKNQIREINPKEAFLYMGFENNDYLKASRFVSVNKLIYLCGNSIVVNVLEKIFESLRF